MDAICAQGRKNNQHGEPRRSLEGLDCLGMLAGNASEHAISVRQTQASVAGESALRRHRLPQKGSEPRVEARKVVSVVVDRQSVQHLRIGIEDQHAHVGERGQVQHVHERLRHAFLAVLLH